MPKLAEALLRHSQHYLAVLRSANELYKQGDEQLNQGLAVFDLEMGNIQAGFAYTENCAKDSRTVSLCNAYPIAGFYLLNLRLNPDERLHWFKAGHAAARQLKDRNAEGMHIGNIGSAYSDLGENGKALMCYEKFLQISRKIGDFQSQTNALGLLGLAYLNHHDNIKAASSFEEELVLARKVKNRRAEGLALNHLGLIYALSGQPQRAIETWEQDLKISREIGDTHNEGTTLGNMGISYAKLGKKDRALDLYQQHVEIARKLGDKSSGARSLWNASLLLAELGPYDAAISAAEEVLTIHEQIDMGESDETRSVRNHIAHWREGSSPPQVTLWTGSF